MHEVLVLIKVRVTIPISLFFFFQLFSFLFWATKQSITLLFISLWLSFLFLLYLVSNGFGLFFILLQGFGFGFGDEINSWVVCNSFFHFWVTVPILKAWSTGGVGGRPKATRAKSTVGVFASVSRFRIIMILFNKKTNFPIYFCFLCLLVHSTTAFKPQHPLLEETTTTARNKQSRTCPVPLCERIDVIYLHKRKRGDSSCGEWVCQRLRLETKSLWQICSSSSFFIFWLWFLSRTLKHLTQLAS